MTFSPTENRILRLFILITYIVEFSLIPLILLDVLIKGGLIHRYVWFGLLVGYMLFHFVWIIVYWIYYQMLDIRIAHHYHMYIFSSISQIILFVGLITPVTFVNTISDDRFRDYLVTIIFLNFPKLVIYLGLTSLLNNNIRI